MAAHVKLKPSKQFDIDFHPRDLDNIPVPEESKIMANNYAQSNTLSDENDLMLMFEDKVIYGFDYLYKNSKRLMIEINPVTVFYSNAVMSYGTLEHYKGILISQSKNVFNWDEKCEPVNLTHSGMYFQLAINCIINLQASLESFANRIIPENYPFLNKQGNKVERSIDYKLYHAVPDIKKESFILKKYAKFNTMINKLIQLRNDIIHLKPESLTNTGYKGVYRNLLDFDFAKALLAVKTFINFYEPGLIEECECGNNIYFYSGQENQK